MKAVVLSNDRQWTAWRAQGGLAAEHIVYCDNPAFFGFLDGQGVSYRKLDEFAIRAEWDLINAWACEKAASWSRAMGSSAPGRPDWAASIYLYLSYLLVHLAKNLRYAEIAMSDDRITEWTLFDSPLKIFPEFSGNGYLNAFLGQEAEKRKILIRRLKTVSSSQNPVYGFYRVGRLKRSLKSAAARLLAALPHSARGPHWMLSGSIHHLEPVVRRLKGAGASIVYHDSAFHWSNYRFAKKNGLSYWVASVRERPAGEIVEGLRKINREKACGHFEFRGRDLGPEVDAWILSTLEKPMSMRLGEAEDYRRVFSAFNVHSILTDEDYSLRGGSLAAFARAQGVEVHCISHANTHFDFTVPEDKRAFSQSVTYVQSEFERENYARRGWDADRILVTGTPRYDRLFELTRQPKAPRVRPRVLYCGNTFLSPQIPDDYGYLGMALACFSEVACHASDAVLRAAQGLPLDLVIKPHNYQGQATWREFLARKGYPESSYHLAVRPDEDFFSWLSRSDLMIVSCWSTAIVEAALCGVPVVYADLMGTTGPGVEKAAHDGLFVLVRTYEQLRRILEDPARLNSNQAPIRYRGIFDGHAADRVAEALSKVGEKRRKPSFMKGLSVDSMPVA